jgi:hypothetical protein
MAWLLRKNLKFLILKWHPYFTIKRVHPSWHQRSKKNLKVAFAARKNRYHKQRIKQYLHCISWDNNSNILERFTLKDFPPMKESVPNVQSITDQLLFQSFQPRIHQEDHNSE